MAVIIGCGDVSVYHAYKEAGVPVVAGADISEQALERSGGHTGVEKTYRDYRKMLDEVRPDLVTVAAREPLHCEMVIAAEWRTAGGRSLPLTVRSGAA